MEETVDDLKRMRNKVESDLANLENELLLRPTNEDVQAQLETKANKQSVTNALQRKANKTDLENALSIPFFRHPPFHMLNRILVRKAETSDVQNLITMMNGKVDYSSLDTLANVVEAKVDKSELTHIFHSLASKAERTDIDVINTKQTTHTLFCYSISFKLIICYAVF